MYYVIVMFFLSLLQTSYILSWIIPYSLNVDWNKGKKTYLLAGSQYSGPFGAFKDKQEFKSKTSGKLTFKGKDEVFPAYTFAPINYVEASKLEKGSKFKFVWVNEKDILQGYKQKKGSSTKQQIYSGVTNFFKRKSAPSTGKTPPASVSSAPLYTSDGTRKTWGAASNNTWAHFFKDTVYANKPSTMGQGVDFRKYYAFMNTYPENVSSAADQGEAPIKLGLYYDVRNIGAPINMWRHAESYYQAMKKVYQNGTYDPGALAQVLGWDQRGEIMEIYRNYKGKVSGLRPDWQTINLYIMLDLVRAKFMQNKNMKNILLSTGDKYIVEESTDRSPKTKDSFFGNEVGHYDSAVNNWVTDPAKQPGMGSNILGQILMHVREEFKAGAFLPLTLYTEPVDFFKDQQGVAFSPSGKIWQFSPNDTALKLQDVPLLSAQAAQGGACPPPSVPGKIPPVIPPVVPPTIPPVIYSATPLKKAMQKLVIALEQLVFYVI